MNGKWIVVTLLSLGMLALGIGLAAAQAPQAQTLAPAGTSFTYQGRLTGAAGPIDGACDLQFKLFDAASGGAQVGTTQTSPGLTLQDGLFTTQLDFGPGAFAGQARWLEIALRCPAGSGAYTLLSPRQPLTAAPYALYALAGPYTAGTGLLLANDTFSLAPAYQLPQACASGQVAEWDGSAWTCGQGGSGGGWSLTGNAGTVPGTNFLGTTDGVSLTLAVSGTAALRIVPAYGFGYWGSSPNLIGGYEGNYALPGVFGAVIGGGGTPIEGEDPYGPGAPAPNLISGHHGTVVGGIGNEAGVLAFIGGGGRNTASGYKATVGGGNSNQATGSYATVGGGAGNIASSEATVSGGRMNTASGDQAFVGAGTGNTASGVRATIGGGDTNTASSSHATVGGGDHNEASGQRTTVGGGYYNTASGLYATVGGGFSNQALAEGATIGGGGEPGCGPEGQDCPNEVTGNYGTVAGGSANRASSYAAVGGGWANLASGSHATVGGGDSNRAEGDQSTVGGGGSNVSSGIRATAGGGGGNSVEGAYATVAGGLRASASHYGQMAHASGDFGAAGSAQESQYVLRNLTTNATPTELFLDGSTERLTLEDGQTFTFHILVVARSDSGQSAGYRIYGLVERVGATTSFVGTPNVSALGEDVAAWNVAVLADNANEALIIRVTGSANTQIRWVASVRTAEVAW